MPHKADSGVSNYRNMKQVISNIKSKAELKERLDNCVLSDIELQVATLYYMELKSLDYIADTLNISYSTAKRRLKTATKSLSQV